VRYYKKECYINTLTFTFINTVHLTTFYTCALCRLCTAEVIVFFTMSQDFGQAKYPTLTMQKHQRYRYLTQTSIQLGEWSFYAVWNMLLTHVR